MEKKESLNRQEGGLKLKSFSTQEKISGFSSKIFGIIKLILGIFLLPFVYSATIAFIDQAGLIKTVAQDYLWFGALTFILIYLFIWEPAPIYGFGHKILEAVFNFFKPLVKVAPFLLPIYTILFLVAYALFSLLIKSEWLIHYAMFLFGFTMAMHFVFSSKSIRAKKGEFLKGNYIFGFSFIWIIDLGILAFGLSLIFKEFSFITFCESTYLTASSIFYAVFKQLFLR